MPITVKNDAYHCEDDPLRADVSVSSPCVCQVRVASLLRRNIFYEGEVMKLIELLIKSYEPHKMPASYMGDCAIMTHAVLKQLEAFGGGLVLAKRKKKKKPAKKSAGGVEGLDEPEGAGDGADGAEGTGQPGAGDADDGDGGGEAQVHQSCPPLRFLSSAALGSMTCFMVPHAASVCTNSCVFA